MDTTPPQGTGIIHVPLTGYTVPCVHCGLGHGLCTCDIQKNTAPDGWLEKLRELCRKYRDEQ